MAVDESDVQKIAALARLDVPAAQRATLARQLSDILGHMEVLRSVDTSSVTPAMGVGPDAMPLRDDVVAPIPMTVPATALTAAARDGFILVPRLSTHGAA